MQLSRITAARLKARAIINASVPGIDATQVQLGVSVPDDEDKEYFKRLRSKTPLAWSTASTNATITFDSPHSFAVNQVVTVWLQSLSQPYAVTITAKTDNSITFVNPEPSNNSVTITDGDLVMTLVILIKAAVNKTFKVQECIGDSVVEILLYFGLEYASQTFLAIEDMCMKMRSVFVDVSSWTGTNDGPDEVEIEDPHLNRNNNPVSGYYKMTLKFSGV